MESKNIIGIMSGTSLDGLDIALCNFRKNDNWFYEIIEAITIPYSDEWISKLSNADSLSGIDLLKLDKEFGRYIGESVNEFIKNTDTQVDLIASHGHTVFHQPEQKITLQIGDGNEIASTTGITTISDFRSLDVALGGQGAPLVPIGDELLFSDFDYCINIGGFANISFKENSKRLAYDICPANIILNTFAQKLGKSYDKDGELGKTGKINIELLQELNNVDYYTRSYPKSLGKEWLNKIFTPVLKNSDISLNDKFRTLYEHIAQQISLAINSSNNPKVLITGGGAYNKFLIDLIKQKSNANINIPEKQLIEYKEALIFAFLGFLRFNNQVNCLSSVTGATKDSSGGVIHFV